MVDPEPIPTAGEGAENGGSTTPAEIQQAISESRYAATSATGNATIHITNYYYREGLASAKQPAASPADADCANLPSPYRGLFHFGPADAEFFFGRDLFINELYVAAQAGRFITVLGASGSGKSSVVLAGLVPKLQQSGSWRFTHFRPGADPFHGLAQALVPLYATKLNETEQIAQVRQLANYLRQGDLHLVDVFAQIQHTVPNDRILLIADQFEELYSLCPEEAVRRNFLDQLVALFQKGVQLSSIGGAVRSPLVVLTMRADFLGNALSYRPFSDVLQKSDLKLGPMNQDELTDVITKPAKKFEVAFEVGLVDRILKDVEAEPGNLPLLEFALTEMWKQRQGKLLTHIAYTNIGEVQGALARHADASYGRLRPEVQKQMRRIFIQLVRPGEGTEDTRRLATKEELGESNWALVIQLADDRLVVTTRSDANQMETVEVVHEALIRNWGELREWMVTERVFRVWQERMRAAMAQWQATQGDEGSLLRGAALVEAEEKLKQYGEDLSPAEQTFIQQSVELRNRLVREEKRRQFWRMASFALIPFAIFITWSFWNLLSKPKSPFLLKQLSTIDQITDANPLDASYQALSNLLDKYGVSPPLYSDGSFRSYEHISREQLIIYFINLWNQLIQLQKSATQSVPGCRLPEPTNKYYFNPPKDVTPQAWYYEAYKGLAVESGLGNKNSPFFPLKDGLFHSDLSLTRAEMAVAVNRLMNAYFEAYIDVTEAQNSYNSESSPLRLSYMHAVYGHTMLTQLTSISQFSDVKPKDWFYEDIQSLIERYGSIGPWIDGTSDGTFGPNKLATRGYFVFLLNATVDRVAEVLDELRARRICHPPPHDRLAR
jgi:hypothetical protein